jgi:hypothetical protein
VHLGGCSRARGRWKRAREREREHGISTARARLRNTEGGLRTPGLSIVHWGEYGGPSRGKNILPNDSSARITDRMKASTPHNAEVVFDRPKPELARAHLFYE